MYLYNTASLFINTYINSCIFLNESFLEVLILAVLDMEKNLPEDVF